jgi:hypothetical protein
MSQSSLSEAVKQESIFGQFYDSATVKTVQRKLEEAGIAPEHITLQSETFQPRLKLKATQTFANLKSGAIAGGVLGALVGLFISLMNTHFFSLGLAAFSRFQPLDYLAPLMGGIIGASGISLISGITGASTPKSEAAPQEPSLDKRYLLIVKGTEEEIKTAHNIFSQQKDMIASES